MLSSRKFVRLTLFLQNLRSNITKWLKEEVGADCSLWVHVQVLQRKTIALLFVFFFASVVIKVLPHVKALEREKKTEACADRSSPLPHRTS